MSEFSDSLLHSPWLLPVLAVLIALDGPVPLLPSESLLIVAVSAAAAGKDVPGMPALLLTAMAGSVLGDGAVYALGRWSQRLVRATADDTGGVVAWVGRTVRARPVVTCVGARLLPGGRLVSTAVCGRLRVPFAVFLVASVASSAVWSAYLLLVGTVLGPLTNGDPILSLVAALLLGMATAGVFALARRVLANRKAHQEFSPPRPPGAASPPLVTRANSTRSGRSPDDACPPAHRAARQRSASRRSPSR
jgi:membrane-associated protein